MKRRVALFPLAMLLAIGLVAALAARADDVPDNVRAKYDQAKALFAEGDTKKAYSALSKVKSRNPDSVDFWHLYVRVWRALGKKETTLWGKILAKAEKAHPGSTTWVMLRYRLATTTEERLELLKTAVEKAPDQVDLRLKLAREYLANDDETEAEDILEAILEKDPTNEVALVTKGEMMIASGFTRSAIDFAEEALEKHELPSLHDLAARGLLLVAENDEAVLGKAEEHARKAVAGGPEASYVLTLANILDLAGKEKDAVAALKDAYEKTSAPQLAGRLGELAFRAGDYESAVTGLGVAAPEEENAARALLMCEARCGRAQEARAAAKHLVRLDAEEGWLWAAAAELMLGDPAAAVRFTEGKSGDGADYMRAAAMALQGRAAEVAKLVGPGARDGSRGGEEYLLEVARAHLLQKLGAKAGAAQKTLQEARYAAGRAQVSGATVPELEKSVDAESAGFMRRYVTYRRALDGSWFEPGQLTPIAPADMGEAPGIGCGIVAASDCARDAQRTFPFNAQAMVEGASITLGFPQNDELWEAATKSFTEGCAALVDGDFKAADAAFGKTLEAEKAWGRARLFQAVARACDGADLEAAATLAAEALEALPDDWDGGEVALLIRILAGKSVAGEAKALMERLESYSVRRYEEF